MIRRQQKPITIRSDRAYAQLQLLTRNGRSQVDVVEAALDHLARAERPHDLAVQRARVAEIQAAFGREDRKFDNMAESVAAEYDPDGDPR